MKANLFLSQDSRDLPLICFVLLVVAAKISTSRVCLGTVSSKIVSEAYKRSLSKGESRYILPIDIVIWRLCIIIVLSSFFLSSSLPLGYFYNHH